MEQGIYTQTPTDARATIPARASTASGPAWRAAPHDGGRRFDLYTFVHKGLRACMCDTLNAVGRMDIADADDVAAVASRIRALIEMCRTHLEKEERYVHPAMEARRPGSSGRTAADHVDHPAAFDRIEGELRAIEGGNGDVNRLYRHLALFVADNFVHMHAEETDNNAALQAAYDDAELARIEHEIVASIPPGLRVQWMRWMVPAMSPAERAALLGGVKADLPAPAMGALVAAVRPHLSAGEWAKLSAELAL